ncbi:hypothetical protein SCA6_003239 [Theobroma cacao]
MPGYLTFISSIRLFLFMLSFIYDSNFRFLKRVKNIDRAFSLSRTLLEVLTILQGIMNYKQIFTQYKIYPTTIIIINIKKNSSKSRSNPIRHFSAKELLRAINNLDASQIFVRKGRYTLYKGSLKDRPIFVKKYCYGDHPRFDFAFKDIAIGSQMSVHKNVLKVIGCCLETEVPTIVYEFAGTNIFSTCISGTDVQLLPWKSRLKIAIGLANVLAYLHTAFSRPVIHRDIKSSNIILDQNNAPKLIDFRLRISIPEGQSPLEGDVIRRTEWLTPPENWSTSYLTEKADVYQFGMLLIEF